MSDAIKDAEQQRLDAIKARADAASKGPWQSYSGKLRPKLPTVINEVRGPGSNTIVAWGGFDGVDASNKQKKADAKFIAHVRDDVPFLLEKITALSAERDAALARAEKAEAALNTPEILDFTKAVVSEAAHQRARWPSEYDAGKSDADWYWLIRYLAGKALHNPANEMPADEARLHRIVTVAAAAANWHLSALGKTNMRPGSDASLTERE